MSKPDTLADRIKLLLSTGNDADVNFLVEQDDEKEELSAHKLILKSASDVFEAMFRFDTEKSKNSAGKPAAASDVIGTVVVTDVKIVAFKIMLSFIYADDLSEMNGENAMAVLYAAKKYHIAGLVKACLDFPIPKLNNVFLAFDEARLLEEMNFAERCLDYIDQNADTLIQSDAFLQIDQKLLCELLDRDQLKISGELTIWKAALSWAKEECRQNEIESTAENCREMLGPALFKIRFPLIPQDEFSKSIVPSKVLKHEEVVSVLLYHSHPDSGVPGIYPLQFPTKQRTYFCKGRITMRIENFSKFVHEKENKRRLSEVVYIKGLPWQIVAYSNTEKGTEKKYLGFYLSCNSETNNVMLKHQNVQLNEKLDKMSILAAYFGKKRMEWSCSCRAMHRIVSQKKGTNDHTLLISRTFNSKSHCWGRPHFMSFEKLMDLDNGLYDKEQDMIVLATDVFAEEPYDDGTK